MTEPWEFGEHRVGSGQPSARPWPATDHGAGRYRVTSPVQREDSGRNTPAGALAAGRMELGHPGGAGRLPHGRPDLHGFTVEVLGVVLRLPWVGWPSAMDDQLHP
jgi:hypothetical protein